MEMHTFNIDKLVVKVYKNRADLGKAAAYDFMETFKRKVFADPDIRMIFAAAPSQNDFLENLVMHKELPWNKVTAFHMDEYLGLGRGDKRLFQEFLKDKIFSRLSFKNVHYLKPDKDNPADECKRYSSLLSEKPVDMIAMGIGENGHIAFNDPPVADFNDPQIVKVVELDEKCRQQQVNDGAYNEINQVPLSALSLTVSALMGGNTLFCMVPGHLKADAVKQTLLGPIETACPASILRTHPDATLYLDRESASYLF